MRLIEKIEIKHFRSFLGTTQSDKAEILDISDLNIFSGANDSGKSNVLRALNLFFNGEIDNLRPFNFDTDFSLLKKDFTQKVIEIKIFFSVNKRKFSISKFYNRSGFRNFEYRFLEKGKEVIIDYRQEENFRRYGAQGKTPNTDIVKKEKGYRTSVTQFLASISFAYVPAIRDERFFSHLYGKIILQMKNNEEREINNLNIEKRKIENYEKTLSNTSENPRFINSLKDEFWRQARIQEITNEIKQKSTLKNAISDLESQINKFSETLFDSAKFLSSEFKIGNNLREFFESFDIGTGERKDISLRLRGDGIQAKFIPEMLAFLDSIQLSKRYFIWGFEEPENSAEYKNQQELARKCKDVFSKDKQIFLTTHSEEFLSIYDGKDIEKDKRVANLYHVRKVSNKTFTDFSVINLFDVETQSFDFATVKSDIERDIGSSLIRAKYSKELKDKEDKFLEEKKKLEQEKIQSEEEFKQQIVKLNNHLPNKIFICEDENGIQLWENLLAKQEIENVKVLSSNGCTDNNVEVWLKGNIRQNEAYNPKVFRSLDRDGYTNNQIIFLEEQLREKNGRKLGIEHYKIKFLPVNELENFAVLSDNYFTETLINQNKNHLEDVFLQTAEENIRQNNAKFKTELFDPRKTAKISNQMLREAETDLLKYFPGKEIKNLKSNFNVKLFLRALKPTDYPIELENYLNEIKKFFES
jgi:predicted ATP-dependent endonuclease of OLD family